jgi:low affinity Fe/Cu permease
MRTNSLGNKGLSLSQAQSISNLCNQEARDIQSKIDSINNCEKTLTLPTGVYIETQGIKMPDDIIDLLQEKARLHATQAFLMDNIQAKDKMLDALKKKRFEFDIPNPTPPDYDVFDYQDEVYEEWGWEQLSRSEYNEYLEAEAFASHHGQFIHKNGKLDKLRSELPKLKTLEWIELEREKKTPMNVTIHHTIDELGELHKNISAIHRQFEQKVNYYKAKVKNLVTLENARIANDNAFLQSFENEANDKRNSQYSIAIQEWQGKRKKAEMEFNANIQNEIGKVAALRIMVDPRFKVVIDRFLDTIGDSKE